MSTSRLEAFSDGVFAIAITLLILEIRPPAASEHLGRDLIGLWPSYAAYAVSFLLIGGVWMNHHAMFEHIARVDHTLLFINLLLLMDVAFLPFPTAVLAEALREGAGEKAASALYGGTLTVGGVFFNGLWLYASGGHRLLGPGITPEAARRIARRFQLGPISYGVATAVGLVAPRVSLAIFAFLIVFYAFEGRAERLGRPALRDV